MIVVLAFSPTSQISSVFIETRRQKYLLEQKQMNIRQKRNQSGQFHAGDRLGYERLWILVAAEFVLVAERDATLARPPLECVRLHLVESGSAVQRQLPQPFGILGIGLDGHLLATRFVDVQTAAEFDQLFRICLHRHYDLLDLCATLFLTSIIVLIRKCNRRVEQ